MDAFTSEMIELLEESYRNVLKIEESMLRSSNLNLTITEIHMVEAIGKSGSEGCTVSDIAQEMKLTVPSVTVAVKKMEKKGYVYKVKCERDGRKAYVRLTRSGSRAYAANRYFHTRMVRSIVSSIREEEQDVLLRGIGNLNRYFVKMLGEMNLPAGRGEEKA